LDWPSRIVVILAELKVVYPSVVFGMIVGVALPVTWPRQHQLFGLAY
jgi:hypothetical protein